MPQKSPKGQLPYGWIVQSSKHYPDRVYYFNINTGASVWECPELDPPRSLSEEEEKKETVMNAHSSSACKRKFTVEEPSENPDKNIKPCTPPTAVVTPVVHKQKQRNPELEIRKKLKLRHNEVEQKLEPDTSKLKKKKKKQKRLSPLNDNSSTTAKFPQELNKKKKKKKRQKRSSPLDDNSNTTEKVSQDKVDVKVPSPKELKEQSANAERRSSVESVKDVEMRDVSMDLLEDLNEKKETVFDTDACYYIVVDTNVLIREMHLISELKDTPLDGCGPPHIFIPWVVIEELDKLKGQKSAKNIGRSATEAIRYLNSVLGKHPRFHGQSPAESKAWAKDYSKCNDDKILECCIALKDKMPVEKVILLTNDKNLVNKALICEINVHNFESLMKKVKPDTVFDYEEMKLGRKRKKEKNDESKSPAISLDKVEERFLTSRKDSSNREIHKVMSNARLLLKDVLFKFLTNEMIEAYGDLWKTFGIEVQLLKGILEAINNKYWRSVFSLFFTEKDKRNFELLLEKARRPEGFLGDKDECLVILSAIEDVFRQIKRRQPTLKVPVEKIQDHRVACVNAFFIYSEAESSIRTAEEKSIRTLLDSNWTAINQLCGIILDYYGVSHNVTYEKISITFPDFEIRRIMTILYPAVTQFRNSLRNINEAVNNCKPMKSAIKKLHTTLLEFIPSLRLPHEPITHQFFTQRALGRFFASPQNRELMEVGLEQIEEFYKKLDEVLRLMLLPHLRSKSPGPETMICD